MNYLNNLDPRVELLVFGKSEIHISYHIKNLCIQY